jgi:hypothetical protein
MVRLDWTLKKVNIQYEDPLPITTIMFVCR